MHVPRICLLLLALGAPMSLFGQTPESRFWSWFQQHEETLFAVRTGDEAICDELASELDRIDAGLTFEFGPVEAGKREFIITAEGAREAFPSVIALGRAAPRLTRWTIIQFRPPRPSFSQVTFADVTVDARTVEFLAEPDGEKTGLVISVPGLKTRNDKAHERATYILLDGILGEYAVEMSVGFIDIIPAQGRPAGPWRPLTRVREAVKTSDPP